MGSAEVLAFLKQMQKALQMLTALQLTAYLFPLTAVVNEHPPTKYKWFNVCVDGDSFDFVIVGAGTAGSVVANRLTRNPAFNVLLIEAGGDPPLESDLPGPIFLMKRSIHEWNYSGQPDKYFGQCHRNPYFDMTLGKMLGGTSSLNYMVYERGTPKDFNTWAETLNDSSWRWENVVPHYESTAKFEGSDNLISTNEPKEYLRYIKEDRDARHLFEAFEELGYDIENTNDEAVNTAYKLRVTVSDGERQSSATSFLTPIKDRQNLKVLKNTVVNKILFNEMKTAVGVEVITNDGKKMTLKATKEIIVSAGPMNSPKLLMLSGIGPKEHLKSLNIDLISDIPVGNNLQDQVTASVLHNIEAIHKPPPPFNPHKYPPTGIGSFGALNKSQGIRDYQTLTFVADPNAVRAYCTFVFFYKNEICDDFYESGVGRVQAFNQVVKLNPKSRGKVMLRSSDPADPPLIYPGYLDNQDDLEDLALYLKDFARIMKTTYFKSVNAEISIPSYLKCGDLDHDSKEFWKCYASCFLNGMSYFTSSCSMGQVVDSQLRVYGVQGLRVVDASVMPSAISGNPYGTVVMIGEKAAGFISKEHKL